MFSESRKRAIVKTFSWRVTATIATILLVYLCVGKINVACMVGGFEVFLKLILFYFHERVWNSINIGKRQKKPFVLWFTGLSGAGKSTLADSIYDYLNDKNLVVEKLDGDVVRDVFPNTGFSREDRNLHVKKIGFLASLLEKNGVIVVASFMSPYKESREFIRNRTNCFIEVLVDASIEECQKRDVKGLYKKAKLGQINNVIGIDEPYELSDKTEIKIDTEKLSVNESLELIKSYLKKYI